jgi:PmbA protein
MLDPASASDTLASLIDQARRAGADAADAVYVGDRSTSVGVRMGALEDVSRAEGQEIGLRLFVGQRNAAVASSDVSRDSLAALVERALAMAREAPEDRYAGLAPEDLLMKGAAAALDLDDGGDPEPAALRQRAQVAEDAARGVAGISNSNGASASATASTFALATSHGFIGATRATGYSCSASVVAGQGADMQRDYGWHSARQWSDLEPP